ncbi:unnamed protein product [Ilex paraguariensis]|uniref:Uncharacterized protein n=1 Tax=Ilex paraguariensis TaxID=185542 RepID=A0ABC8T5X7_9AQUA
MGVLWVKTQQMREVWSQKVVQLAIEAAIEEVIVPREQEAVPQKELMSGEGTPGSWVALAGCWTTLVSWVALAGCWATLEERRATPCVVYKKAEKFWVGNALGGCDLVGDTGDTGGLSGALRARGNTHDSLSGDARNGRSGGVALGVDQASVSVDSTGAGDNAGMLGPDERLSGICREQRASILNSESNVLHFAKEGPC